MTTQAHQLVNAIRSRGARGMSYLELELLKISSCPWGRLRAKERPERFLKAGEKLIRRVGGDGLKRFFVVKTARG